MNISFDNINPYIRYCHSFKLTRGMPFVDVIAYDYRLMYIVDGEGFIVMDGSQYKAVKGCFFYWLPGMPYSLLPTINSPFTIIGINFDFTCNHCEINYPVPPDPESIFIRKNITEIVNFTDLEPFNRPIYLNAMFSMGNLLTEIVNEYSTRKKFYSSKMRGIFTDLLCNLARYVSTAISVTDSTENKVDQIIQYIHENYISPLTNHDIGQHFNFHPIYINRLMVKYTGVSLHQYLINYRISVALNLLQSTHKPITEIAYSVGFRDINYFSKCFKKVVGLSPRNYIGARS